MKLRRKELDSLNISQREKRGTWVEFIYLHWGGGGGGILD